MLSHFERDFLLGKIQLDGKAATNARHRIRKKLKDFAYLELPMLQKALANEDFKYFKRIMEIFANEDWVINKSDKEKITNLKAFREGVRNVLEVEGMANIQLVQSAVNIDWEDFRRYLLAEHRPNTAELILLHAKKYHAIITTPEGPKNIGVLTQMTEAKRRSTMRALANLSKYLGVYNGWKQLKIEHDLRWSRFNPYEQAAAFEQIYNDNSGLSSMIEWFHEMRERVEPEHQSFMDFLVLTGLRPDEAVNSLKLLQNNNYNKNNTCNSYLNTDRMTLEHFRFPEIFIRRTKKAYFSVVTEPLAQIIKDCTAEFESYQSLYWVMYIRLKRHHRQWLESHGKKKIPMNNCRKIYGTWLRQNGIESEVIDMVQGRIASSVFARHYYRPDFNQTCEKIRTLTIKLSEKISE
jgi:hypothetical protein